VTRWGLRAGAVAAVALLVLIGGAGAASVALSGDNLGRLVGDDAGVTFQDLESGGVRVIAPPGTAMLALCGGRAHRLASGAVELDGDKDARGFVVTYANADAPAADNQVAAEAAVGTVPSSGSVDVTATLDGGELDVGTLIEDEVTQGSAPEGSTSLGSASGSTGPMQRPVVGAVVSQGFGCTGFAAEPVDTACPGGHFHSGIDLAAPLGTPVLAALPGRVHVVRTIGGYGLRVELTHAGGLLTLYGHLSGVDVVDGDVVAAGDRIGEVGSSGNSTGPHLHFEVRRTGIAEDPRIDVALP
jgi:murein DD-endopeptidase MepM/ murein hydrolase activator NlpD